jgi:hypothetical protein
MVNIKRLEDIVGFITIISKLQREQKNLDIKKSMKQTLRNYLLEYRKITGYFPRDIGKNGSY